MSGKKYYVSTPIYYVNDVPHIGHSCTTLVADVLARYHRQKKEEVFFLTGTDEHGQKVAEEAQKAGLSPIEFCNQIAPRFEKAWKNLNISFDYFIRTTDPRHEKVASKLLEKIYKAGDIYKDKYEGLYCIGCEKFLTESDLKDGKCPLHPPEQTVEQTEENWFFKLSKYVPQLIKLIEDEKTNYIFPSGKRAEVLAKLRSGVNDLSISRANVEWGIPVPWDKKQTIYVWVEALINYYSACQFVEGKKDFWPADLHILGKEILWFHTVIWQAMLLSAGIELPHKTYTHSFYIIDGEKMSKSKGNVISPDQLVEKFGVDGARYLVLASFPSENDADVGISRFVEKYNADLANNLGNLVSRLSALAQKNKVAVKKTEAKFYPEVEEALENCDTARALSFIFLEKLDKLNAFLNEKKPWALDQDQARVVIEECIEKLQEVVFNLGPFLPDTAEKIEKIFDGKAEIAGVLFPKI
jgi:methionyl-tRNA synthetase